MTWTRPRLRPASLALLLATADAALALSFGNPVAWGLAVAALSTLGWRLAVPPGLAGALVWASRAAIAALLVTGDDNAPALGLVLGLLALVFVADEHTFAPGAATLPAILAILLAAAFNPVAVALPALSLIGTVWLVLWLATTPEGRLPLRRLATVAVFVLPSAAAGFAILRLLPWAQPHVERATSRFISPDTAETGLGGRPWLGSVEQLTQTKRVVLRVWSDAPRALRANVYTRLNGRAWGNAEVRSSSTVFVARDGARAEASWERRVPGRWSDRNDETAHAPGALTRIVVAAPLLGTLPAPAGVQAVRLVASDVTVDAFGLVLAPPRIPAVYGVKHTGVEPEGEAAQAREGLWLPATVDPRVRALALRLSTPDSKVEQKIERTVSELQSCCRYSLKVGRWTTQDPVSEFLFEKRRGYCEYFATATVLLLRLQGVPARYVSGFSVRANSRRGDHYVVRTADAHAWAEALVPGRGWIEVDATPPADRAAVENELAMSRFDEWLETVRAWASDLAARVQEGGWGPVLREWTEGLARRPIVWILAAAAAAAGLARVWRRRAASHALPAVSATAPPASDDPALRACFARLERLWAEAGCPRPAHRAPLEHAAALPRDQEALRALSDDVVASLYRDVYGGRPTPSAETARLAAALDAFHRTLS